MNIRHFKRPDGKVVGDTGKAIPDDWIEIDSMEEVRKLSGPTGAEKRKAERERIHRQLDALDLERIRPMAAILNETATEADRKRLSDIEKQADKLRKKLQS